MRDANSKKALFRMHFSVKNRDYDSGIIKNDLDNIAIGITRKNVKIVVAFGYTLRPQDESMTENSSLGIGDS
jgi:hypothetical protein